ncbi:MAG: transketolase, partial [Rubricoccaceae bacterium]|nr:transketolase [Rubricoccaceae bacterium]
MAETLVAESSVDTPNDAKEDRADLAALTARTIRGLSMDAVQAAESGHPGMPMGMADVATVLWTKFLKHNPKDPDWPDRDRFVLSAGHGSMLLYSLLHLSGYDLPLQEIKNFRQLKSKTPGHPENFVTVGVETTTGPLGQGLSNAVGMAVAEKHLAAVFNTDEHTIVDHHTYVIASDGDLMEGITNEACSLAGHLGLGKLIVFWDDNSISIDGSTDLAFTEDVHARYRALGWHVIGPIDGHDHEAIEEAIRQAQAEIRRPTLVDCKTTIGFGSPNRAGTAKAHGEPLGEDEVALTKENLGIPQEPKFLVPDGADTLLKEHAFSGMETHCKWQGRFNEYRETHTEKANEFARRIAGDLPEDWDCGIPTFETDESGMATRAASGKVLEALTETLPELIGGSADLSGSNKTKTNATKPFTADDPLGRYIYFGVREHAMGAMLNGMTLHGGVRGYGGTFLIFYDYMRPAVRLAALMRINPVFVFTHDSIGLGEDGPTHQPVEQLAGLRSVPNCWVIRPAD